MKKMTQILCATILFTIAALMLGSCSTSSDSSSGWSGGNDYSGGSTSLQVGTVTNLNNPGSSLRSGDWVSIQGHGFGASQGNGGVQFHFDTSLTAFADLYSQWTDNQIVCRVPQAPSRSQKIHSDSTAPIPASLSRAVISFDIITNGGSSSSSSIDYDPQPNPTPSSTPPSTTPSPTPTVSPTASVSPSPTATVSPSPAPSPTQTGGGGGGSTLQWWNLGNSGLTQSLNTKIKVGYDNNSNITPYFITLTNTPAYTVHVGCITQSGYKALGSYPGGDQYYGDSLAVDGSTVYLATHYTQTKESSEPVVAINKYTWGTGWTSLGTISGCSYPWLCVSNGTPYLSVQKGSYVYLYQYTGEKWTEVQNFDGQYGTISMSNNTIYLSYLPYNSISSLKVESITTGGAWQSLGTIPGIGGYAPIYSGSSGLYVATNNNVTSLVVMKYNASGSTWNTVGSQLEASTSYITSYLGGLCEYKGNPCIAYMYIDPTTDKYVYSVKYYNGTAWQSLGNPSFAGPTGGWVRIALDVFNGTPFSGYIDGSSNNTVTVQKYSTVKTLESFLKCIMP